VTSGVVTGAALRAGAWYYTKRLDSFCCGDVGPALIAEQETDSANIFSYKTFILCGPIYTSETLLAG